MNNKSEKRLYSALTAVLFVVAFALGFYTYKYWHQGHVSDPRQAVPIDETLVLNAAPVKAGPVMYTRSYIGRIVPIHEAEIQSFISGFIKQILVTGGQQVRRGDLLVVLDQDQYLAQKQAAAADVSKAGAEYNNAKIYYERLKKAGKSVSPTELDNAQASFMTAAAAVEQALASYKLAEVNYDYTLIRSPIDGVVGDVSLTPGNYVSPQSGPLFSVVRFDPIRVVFSMTDKDYLPKAGKNFLANETIRLRLPDGQEWPYEGVFSYTGNSLDKKTNSISIYADFKNAGRLLVPNGYVDVLVSEVFADAFKFPKMYVQSAPEGDFVYVIRDGKIAKAPAEVLASVENFYILKNIYQDNEWIISQEVTPSMAGRPARGEWHQDDLLTASEAK